MFAITVLTTAVLTIVVVSIIVVRVFHICHVFHGSIFDSVAFGYLGRSAVGLGRRGCFSASTRSSDQRCREEYAKEAYQSCVPHSSGPFIRFFRVRARVVQFVPRAGRRKTKRT